MDEELSMILSHSLTFSAIDRKDSTFNTRPTVLRLTWLDTFVIKKFIWPQKSHGIQHNVLPRTVHTKISIAGQLILIVYREKIIVLTIQALGEDSQS